MASYVTNCLPIITLPTSYVIFLEVFWKWKAKKCTFGFSKTLIARKSQQVSAWSRRTTYSSLTLKRFGHFRLWNQAAIDHWRYELIADKTIVDILKCGSVHLGPPILQQLRCFDNSGYLRHMNLQNHTGHGNLHRRTFFVPNIHDILTCRQADKNAYI